MYHRKDYDQLSIEEFFLPFGGKLRKDNRWVRLAAMMPWEYIDEVYARSMNEETGRKAIPSRIAFGALFIKEYCNLTDESTVSEIQENPYMQYFLGLHEFQDEPLFNPSMMVHFRKRFPVNEVAQINEYLCTRQRPEEMRDVDRNKGAQQEGQQKEEKEQEADNTSSHNDDNTPSATSGEPGSKSTGRKKGRHKASTSNKEAEEEEEKPW